MINTQFYTKYRPRACSMFYLYEGYRSVTPLDAAGSTGRFSKTINSCIKLRTTRQLPIFNLFSTATEESSFFHLPLTCSSSAPIVLLFVVVLRLLFERSEFLIATSKKKKTERLCGCVCVDVRICFGFSVEKLVLILV